MTETVPVQDVFAAVVPDRLRDASQAEIVSELEAIALRGAVQQYQGFAVPRILAFSALDWLITSNPDQVERFQPAHDCAACRAGNDQIVAFLKDQPTKRVALANLSYTEVWPAMRNRANRDRSREDGRHD